MTKAMDGRREYRIALACVAAITLVRFLVLVDSPLELYPDEAQYWWWAQSPAFGYFSKPPMIAWIIWVTTHGLGDAEWAVRFASPVLHAATTMAVFAIAQRVFDARSALLSALAYATAPGVSYSSGLISTDVPLLLFWSVSLYAFLRARETSGWRWPLLCGVALGAGLLSKYAMLYFVLCAAIAAVLDARARAFVLSIRGAAALLLALIVFAPNAVWNAQHGFPTLVHTQSNAQWGRARFSLANSLGFFLGQFGVVGPLLMAGFVGRVWRLARTAERNCGEIVLAAFSVPPLVLMIAQSFVATANANWAATAYVAAVPLALCELQSWWKGRALWISFVSNGTAMVLLWIVVAMPSAGESMGIGNAFKREEGWRELVVRVAAEASHRRYDAVVAVNRSELAELLYYGRGLPIPPIRAFGAKGPPKDHFQLTIPWRPTSGHVLLAIGQEEAKGMTADFDSATLVATIAIPIGGHRSRITQLYDAQGYRRI